MTADPQWEGKAKLHVSENRIVGACAACHSVNHLFYIMGAISDRTSLSTSMTFLSVASLTGAGVSMIDPGGQGIRISRFVDSR